MNEPARSEGAATRAAEDAAVRSAAEAAHARAAPVPVTLPPPGAYRAPLDGGTVPPCPFPCSVCRRKGRQ